MNPSPCYKVYLSLGSNLGNKKENLLRALELIKKEVGIITAKSAIYETDPWGYVSDNKFLNMAVEVETCYSPYQVLMITRQIESITGRIHKTRNEYEDRLIDIDIVLYESFIIRSEELTIPHSQMHKRDFVLMPLKEIIPEYIHPVLGKKIKEL